MKKHIIMLLTIICLLCCIAFTITACKGVKMTISFVVDGETYSTIDTSGNEIVTIPQSPTKDGHTFDGWYWDNGTWQRPFTANSLLNEPLTADMSVYAKFVVDEQYNNLKGTEIKTDVFTANGDNLSATVANNVTTFSFINAINVANGATFVVSTDLAANDVIRTKTVSLEIGDNTYYVLVENGNDIQLYTVTLRRRPIYTVTFTANDGTRYDSQQVEEGGCATASTKSRTGYTFEGWNYDFTTPIMANTTIVSNWIANKYTVAYALEGGVLNDTEYTATYADWYTLSVPTREGYSFQGWYIDKTKITGANGQSVSRWFYADNKTATANWSINSYNLTIDSPYSGAGTVTGTSAKVYNSEVTVTANVHLGYTWLGWYIGDDLITNELSYTFNMPASVLRLTANYKVNDEMSIFNFASTPTLCSIRGLYDYSATDIFIPDYVTAIGNSAFYGCSDIKNVVIADNVKEIGVSAFYGCNGLKSLTIGSGVINIGDSAFRGCSSLIKITIPDSVTSIGYGAFFDCNAMEDIVIGNNVTNLNGFTFKNNTNIKNIVIGKGITSITGSTFSGCSSLESITLPFVGKLPFGYIFGTSSYTGGVATTQYYQSTSGGSLSSIGYYIPSGLKSVTITSGDIPYGAFYNCSSLTNVTMPNSVTTISECAFYNCGNLTSIAFPDSLTTIGRSAFYNCSSLTSIYYTGDVASWCGISGLDYIMSISRTLYINNEELIGELVIPETVTEIKEGAFNGCAGLTSLTIPDSVVTIGYAAFWNCSGLENVVIGNNVADLNGFGFSNNVNLKNITIGNSIISIGDYAFQNCSNLTNITLGNSLISIGAYAFQNCSSLTNVYFTGDLEDWCGINGLLSLMFYSSPTSLYINNKRLFGELVIPDTVTEIKPFAFYGYKGISSVRLSNSVTTIGKQAFNNCYYLKAVYYKGTEDDWSRISIDYYNTNLTNATRYYYSENEPELNGAGAAYNGNYWHYVDDKVTIWKKEN